MLEIPVVPSTCGNWKEEGAYCRLAGTKACGRCRMVAYCSATCQRDHWPFHKEQCCSQLSKDTWRPSWERECRQPAWATGPESTRPHNRFGGTKYLWGNTPAIDVLRLDRNEGLDYQEDLALLFAASGDLRHVIKTISNFPCRIQQKVRVTINDMEFDVVARNAILVLLALYCQEPPFCNDPNAMARFVDAMIHIWYSSCIPQGAQSLIQEVVGPLIQDVCSQTPTPDEDEMLCKTWKLGSRSMSLALTRRDWLQLKIMTNLEPNLTAERAAEMRKTVTLAPSRADYRDRWYYKDASPFMRMAKRQFQRDGLLLPFGHPRLGFDKPNPTLFSGQNWPLSDQADPSDGWPLSDIAATSFPASNDWYGKLYTYLQGLLQEFCRRISTANIHFELFNVDARVLPQYIGVGKYSRIEVSNVCDTGYIGIGKTLSLFAPHLAAKAVNPYATIITLFLNAVKEQELVDELTEVPNMEYIYRYIPPRQLLRVPVEIDADFYRLHDARYLTVDVEAPFQRYMSRLEFYKTSADVGVVMKVKNTIVEEWPTRLKLRPGQQGAEEEFRQNLGSGFTSLERYVEWKIR